MYILLIELADQYVVYRVLTEYYRMAQFGLSLYIFVVHKFHLKTFFLIYNKSWTKLFLRFLDHNIKFNLIRGICTIKLPILFNLCFLKTFEKKIKNNFIFFSLKNFNGEILNSRWNFRWTFEISNLICWFELLFDSLYFNIKQVDLNIWGCCLFPTPPPPSMVTHPKLSPLVLLVKLTHGGERPNTLDGLIFIFS